MAFLAKADLWFAFEPGSCDRNRLEELLGETDYKSVRGKLGRLQPCLAEAYHNYGV